MERHLSAADRERQITELVEDDAIDADELVGQFPGLAGTRLGLELIDPVERGEEPNARAVAPAIGPDRLMAEQYPLIIFCGDVGTGKTVTAECIASRLVAEARTEDSVLFKLSNRVRGRGKVGEMGTLITEAFQKVTQAAGKGRRAILVIDEGDSLATTRARITATTKTRSASTR